MSMFTPKLRTIEKSMSRAEDYAAWSDAARAHDMASGAHGWKMSDKSRHFDSRSIRRRLDKLNGFLEQGDSHGLLFALNEGIHGNMDGMGHVRLHERAQFGTKALIQDYVDAIVRSLDYLASVDETEIPFEEKLDFFRRAQHCYGRSAFLMSGSGNFLYFHLGVMQAMWREGVLPNIISGSSGGSIVGAIVCSHTDDDVERYFDLDYLENILGTEDAELNPKSGRKAYLRGQKVKRILSKIIPDLTFQEAYELTGRQLNVSIAPAEQHQKSRLLNAIASPNVCIREAVRASCAVPGVYPPVALMAKDENGERQPYLENRRWVDGSVTNDLPAKRLSRLYGVNHYIVSQANPLVSTFVSSLTSENQMAAAITRASTATFKAWANANAAIFQKPLSKLPRLNSATNLALSMINQNYSGDINIIRPPVYWAPQKILGDITRKDMETLVDLGQRTSWPKIEMIRTQSRISQVLDRILVSFDEKLVYEHEALAAKKVA